MNKRNSLCILIATIAAVVFVTTSCAQKAGSGWKPGAAYTPLLDTPPLVYQNGSLQVDYTDIYLFDILGIHVSVNGGKTYSDVPCNPASDPYALYISKSLIAVVCFSDGETNIYTSTDEGKTWKTNPLGDKPYTVHAATNYDFPFVDGGYYIQFTDQEHGWLLIQSAPVAWPYDTAQQHFDRLFTTSDGGATWKETNYPNDLSHGNESIAGVGFVTDKIGFISLPSTAKRVGPYVEWTSDGGATWSTANLNRIGDGVAFSPVFDGTNGILPVKYDNGPVYYTTNDYGKTWVAPAGATEIYSKIN